MRSASGGWVSNRRFVLAWRASPSRWSGATSQRCAVARDTWCSTVWSASSFSRARRRPSGDTIATALVSASSSRWREMASDSIRAPNASTPARAAMARSSERPAVVVVVAAAPVGEERRAGRDVGDHDEQADGGDRERRHLHVTVADVGQLVGEHALELAARHEVEQAAGDRDAGVARGATEREGVGRGIVDDVDLRLRQPGRDAQAFDHVVQHGRLFRGHLHGPGQRDRGAHRDEPADEVGGDCDRRAHSDAGAGRAGHEQTDRAAEQPDEQELDHQHDDAGPPVLGDQVVMRDRVGGGHYGQWYGRAPRRRSGGPDGRQGCTGARGPEVAAA